MCTPWSWGQNIFDRAINFAILQQVWSSIAYSCEITNFQHELTLTVSMGEVGITTCSDQFHEVCVVFKYMGDSFITYGATTTVMVTKIHWPQCSWSSLSSSEKLKMWSENLKFIIYEILDNSVQFSSVHFSCSVMSDSLQPHESQHARPPCLSPTPGVHPNPCPSSWWCHPTISSSVIPFSSCPQSFPESVSFPMNQLFTSGEQSTGVSTSTSVLPVNTQDWSPFGWTGWISLQSKGLSRVFFNTIVQKHQFFSSQLSL